jgi:hypothetical protein
MSVFHTHDPRTGATIGPALNEDGPAEVDAAVAGALQASTGFADLEPGDQGLDLAGGHARARAERQGGGVGRSRHPAASRAPGENERRLRRRRVGAQPAAQPIDGPVRQEERDDPSHRKRPE